MDGPQSYMILAPEVLSLPGGDGITLVEYSCSSGLLALYPSRQAADSAPSVTYYQVENGSKTAVTSVLERSDVSCITWHPCRPLLAVGLQNGSVLLHDPLTGSCSPSYSSAIKSQITLMRFADNGHRLLASDRSGTVQIWACDGPEDSLPVLTKMHSHVLTTPATHACLRAYDQTGLAPLSPDDSPLHAQWVLAGKDAATLIDDAGGFMTIPLEGQPLSLLFWPVADTVVILSRPNLLYRLTFSPRGLVLGARATLALPQLPVSACWCGTGLLAVAAGAVRVFDLATMSTYILDSDVSEDMAVTSRREADEVQRVAYCPIRHLLVCVSRRRTTVWESVVPLPHDNPSDSDWVFRGPLEQPQSETDAPQLLFPAVSGPVITYSGTKAVVSRVWSPVSSADHTSRLSVVQTGPKELLVTMPGKTGKATLPIVFDHVAVCGMTIMVTGPTGAAIIEAGAGGTSVSVGTPIEIERPSPIADVAALRVRSQQQRVSSTLPVPMSDTLVLFALAVGNTVELVSAQGTEVLKLSLPEPKQLSAESDEPASVLAVGGNGPYLVAADSRGIIAAWEILPQTPIVQARALQSRAFPTYFEPTAAKYRVHSLAISSAGTSTAIQFTQMLDGGDRVGASFVAIMSTLGGDIPVSQPVSFVDSCSPSHVPSRVAFDAYWTPSDGQQLFAGGEPRLLMVAETPVIEDNIDNANSLLIPGISMPSDPRLRCAPVASLFFVGDDDAALHGRYILAPQAEPVTLSVPEVWMGSGAPFVVPGLSMLLDQPFSAKSAIMEFSYCLAHNDVSAAFSHVSSAALSDGSSVWRPLLQLCVRNRRLDVAMTCLEKLGMTEVVVQMREALHNYAGFKGIHVPLQLGGTHGTLDEAVAAEDDQIEAHALASLALSLGLEETAIDLLASSEDYAAVTRLLFASGRTDKAEKYARSNCPAALPELLYVQAAEDEATGRIVNAIDGYREADAPEEAARLMASTGDVQGLERFIQGSVDPAPLYLWRGHLLEAQGQYDAARSDYASAGETGELVRLLAIYDSVDAAHSFVQRLPQGQGSGLAAFQLGRLLESTGDYEGAVRTFADAGSTTHALRLAMAGGQEAQVAALGSNLPLYRGGEFLQDNQRLLIRCSDWLAERGAHARAVTLAVKAGAIDRCLSLVAQAEGSADAEETKRALIDYVPSLPQSAPKPQLVQLGQWLLAQERPAEALDAFALANQTKRAVAVCLKYHVPLSEAQAELITPTRDDPERAASLQLIGRLLMQQGNYALATKKFTQAGDKAKAIRALVQVGDPQKVLIYARASRDPEVYLVAANYLQTIDYRSNPDYLKAIQTFYVKAGALLSLVRFFEASAATEIDDNRDYSAALQALATAQKVLPRVPAEQLADQERRRLSADLDARVALLQRFQSARDCANSDPQKTIRICQEMLADPQAERAVKKGDIYGLMVELYMQRQSYSNATRLINEMKSLGLHLDDYLDTGIIARLGGSLPRETAAAIQAPPPPPDEKEESLDEDVVLSSDLSF